LDPFLSPQIVGDLVDSLSSPDARNLSAIDEEFVTALPLSRTPSPPTSPARASRSPEWDSEEDSEEDGDEDGDEDDDEDGDVDMYVSSDEENVLREPSRSFPPAPSPPDGPPSPELPPSPTPISHIPFLALSGQFTPAKYRLLSDENGDLVHVNGLDSNSLWGGMDGPSANFWRTQIETTPFIFATAISQSPTADLVEARGEIKKVIEHHTGIADAVVAVPTYSAGPIRPLIVSRLTPTAISILLDQRTWATAAISFAVWPSTVFPSRYMLTLLHLDIPVNDTTSAKKVIVSALTNDTFFKSFVLANQDAYPLHWNDTRCLNKALNSIQCVGRMLGIRSSEKKTTTFNVYFKPPTNDPTLLNRLYQYLRSQKFPSIWGTATARAPYVCSTCLGQDHPTGLCSYPTLPGWPLSAEAMQAALGSPLPPAHSRQSRTNPGGPARGGQRSRGQGENRSLQGLRGRGNGTKPTGRGGRT